MLAVANSTYIVGLGAGLLAAIFFGGADYFVGVVAEKSSVFASAAIAYIFEFFLVGSLFVFKN